MASDGGRLELLPGPGILEVSFCGGVFGGVIRIYSYGRSKSYQTWDTGTFPEVFGGLKDESE